ncbi:MAG: polyprenyl synthetase family protein [Dehalococcoidia bacterium]|nr:MAG: polyprenyl synthetase family protein [Dehalococcoidia bacterium]
MDLKKYLDQKREIIDEALNQYLPLETEYPQTIHEAMRYSVFAGGKRLRPILVIAAAEVVGGRAEEVLPTACGIELIHTFSLIHDDLPAIDNDDYRRGKLTCHKVFGEDMAILAGDGLLTHAFQMLAQNSEIKTINKQAMPLVIKEVAGAIGTLGLIGGQVVDIQSEGKEIDLPRLEYIHTHKTGALIAISLKVGAMLMDAQEEEIEALFQYGKLIGLAFQIVDDILNVEGDEVQLGKPVGSDLRQKKATYPALFGIEESRQKARRLIEEAKKELEIFGEKGEILRLLADFIVERTF